MVNKPSTAPDTPEDTSDSKTAKDEQKQDPIEQLPPETHESSPPKKKHSHLIYIVIAILVLLISGGDSGWAYYQREHKVKPANETATVKPKVIAKAVKPGYVFYQTPVKLGNLNFFSDTTAMFGATCTGNQTTNCPPTVTPSQINYVQIGLTPTKQPIVDAYNFDLGEGSISYTAVEDTPGHYVVYGQLNDGLNSASTDSQEISNFESNISSNVSLDTTDTIAPLNLPQTITVGGGTFIEPANFSGQIGHFIDGLPGIRGSYYNSPVKSSQIMKIGSSGFLTYYEVIAEDESTYQVDEIYATIGGVYAGAYVPADTIESTSAPDITWTDGSTNTHTYFSAGQGCGSANGFVVAKGINPSQLIKVGVGPVGEPIYELPVSSALFGVYSQETVDSSSGSPVQLTSTQFQNDHAVIVAKNTLNQYVAYERSDLFETGGCGKPVIYLYPKTPTHVNISVGAHITKSSPTYTADGWQNVFAMPDGELTYNGQSYSSLYWEGTGIGFYPLIDSGTVVPHSQVIPTIKKQLAEQGLNNKEIGNFLTFWEPKLPRTPYTRLSWLDTAQMNELAPLQISPKPTTLIRVFLDSQGLDNPISITPQKFSAPPRKGFTVVEWGGLLKK